MSSRIKGIIIGLVLLVIVGAAAAVLLLTKPETDTDPSETSVNPAAEVTSRLIYDYDPLKITSIEIKNAAGNYRVDRVELYGAYLWSVEEFSSVPQNMTFLQALMNNVSSFTAARIITETPADLFVYGFNNPQAEVITSFEDGTVKDLLIGDDSPQSGETYAMIRGSNTVYTVSTSSIANYFKDKYATVQTTVYTAKTAESAEDTTDYSRINKMTITREDLPYEIVIEYDRRQEENPDAIISNSSQYRMTKPVVLDLNPTTSQPTVTAMFGLTAKAVNAVDPTEAELEEYGFIKPFGQVNMNIVGGDFDLTLGNEYTGEDGKPAGRYGMAQDIPAVYSFSYDTIPWATIYPLDITTSLVTGNYIVDLDGVTITGSGYDEDFKISGTSADDLTVTRNGESVDAQAFKTFYQFILRAPAEELHVEDTDTEPVMTIRVYGKNIDDTLEFIKIEDRRSIIRVNGVASFTCKTSYVNRLVEDMGLFMEGKPIIESW